MLQKLRVFLNSLPDNHTYVAEKYGADIADAVEILREYEALADEEEMDVA